MAITNSERQIGDDALVLLTRASVVDAPHISPANRGKADALISVDDYLVAAGSDVIEFLRVRTGPDARPTDLHYVTAGQPGYYEASTGRLFIDRPVRRSDLALYQVGDLRRAGVIR